MSAGTNGRHKAEINMTPMIDVLLVLIIIFMVIAPVTSRGLTALVPQPGLENAQSSNPSHSIVITVHEDGSVMLNRDALDLPALRGRLTEVFKNGAANVVFVRGSKDLQFIHIAQVIDLARSAGAQRIALATD